MIQTSESPIARLPFTVLSGFLEAEAISDGLAVPRGKKETKTKEYGISSFVYRRRQPFQPKRLNDSFNGDLDQGLFCGEARSRGLMWIASRNDWACDWSQARCSIRMAPAGFWWAANSDEPWPEHESVWSEMKDLFPSIKTGTEEMA